METQKALEYLNLASDKLQKILFNEPAHLPVSKLIVHHCQLVIFFLGREEAGQLAVSRAGMNSHFHEAFCDPRQQTVSSSCLSPICLHLH